MSTSSSIKNISIAEIQDAISKSLSELIGCKRCTVHIQAIDFLDDNSVATRILDVGLMEKVDIRLKVDLKHERKFGSNQKL